MANEYGELEQLVNDVTNLDTARMTLRWALERLNSIEKERADLKKNLAMAEDASKQLQGKLGTLEDSLKSRSKSLGEKEEFYTKLEATMALLGSGKLDIQQFLKKEARLDQLRQDLEAEYQDKFENLDRNQRSVIERWNARLLEVESQYAAKLSESQKKYDALRCDLEADHQGRLFALQKNFGARESKLTERISLLETSVKADERGLADRKKELETEFLGKKRELEENYRKFKNLLESGFEDKLRSMDSDHGAQINSLELSWKTERDRLMEEQRVREEQFAAAQDRIKEVENLLASQQECHHGELLKIINQKEAGFRAKMEALEKEREAYAQTVKKLQEQIGLKEAQWSRERETLNDEFSRQFSGIDASVKERTAALEKQYEERKALLESEFEARFSYQLKNLEFEKMRAKELSAAAQEKIAELRKEHEAEKNLLSSAYGEKLVFMEQELIRVQSGNKEEMAVIQENFSREKERNLEEAAKRERSLETAYGEKLAFMEQELIRVQSGSKEDIAVIQENFLREKERLQEEINKREQSLGAAGLKIGQLEDEMTRRRQEQAKVMLEQLSSAEDKFSALLEEQRKRAQSKEAALKAEHEAEKSSLTSAYGDKLAFVEQELIKTQTDSTEALAVTQESALREKERMQEELEKRERAFDERMAAAQARMAKLKEEYEAEKNSLISAYGDKLAFMEQELVKTQTDSTEALAITQENALREKERMQEELEKRERAFDERTAAAQAKMAKLKEEHEAEKSSLGSAFEDKLVFMEQELIRAQNSSKEEQAITQENSLREHERMQEELEKRDRYVETADLKIQQLESEMLRRRQDSAKITLEQMGSQEEKFKALLEEHRAMQNASERDYAAKLATVKEEAASRIKQLEEMLANKENLMAESDKFYSVKQAELDKRHAELNLRLSSINEEMFAQKRALGEKEKELNDQHLSLEKGYAARMAEMERLKAELTRTIIEYKSREH